MEEVKVITSKSGKKYYINKNGNMCVLKTSIDEMKPHKPHKPHKKKFSSEEEKKAYKYLSNIKSYSNNINFDDVKYEDKYNFLIFLSLFQSKLAENINNEKQKTV